MPESVSKPLIFVVISVLIVSLICSPSFTYIASAVPRSAGFRSSQDCTYNTETTLTQATCCWHEDVPPGTGNPDIGGNVERYCQTCSLVTTGVAGNFDWECDEPELQFLVGRTPDIGVLPEDGVFEQPPTPSPFDPAAPQQGGVFEQQEPPTPPPFAPGTFPGVVEQLEQQTPPPFVPGFLERQQPPQADQGAAEEPPAGEGTQSRIPTSPPRTGQGAAPSMGEGTVGEPLIPCEVGTVWDPDIMICVPDLPPVELCPDGSIRQPNGECPALPPTIPTEEERAPLEEAEQPQSEEPEEPEQQPSGEGDGSEDNNDDSSN